MRRSSHVAVSLFASGLCASLCACGGGSGGGDGGGGGGGGGATGVFDLASPTTTLLAGQTPGRMAVGDFDGDGKQDLFVLSGPTGQVTVLKSTGLQTFTVVGPFPAGTDPEGVALGEFTGDGRPDVIVTNRSADTFSILVNVGGTSLAAPTPVASPHLPLAVTTGFFDAGTNLDVVVASSTAGSAQVFLGNGIGGFTPTTPFVLPAGASDVVSADVSADAIPDLVFRTSAGVAVLLGTGAPGFTNLPPVPAGGGPGRILVANVAGSAAKDVILSNPVDDTIAVLLGDDTGAFTDPGFSLPITGDRPVGIAVADFDANGAQDVAVACQGGDVVQVFPIAATGAIGSASDTKVIVGGPIDLGTAEFGGSARPDLAVSLGTGAGVYLLLGK